MNLVRIVFEVIICAARCLIGSVCTAHIFFVQHVGFFEEIVFECLVVVVEPLIDIYSVRNACGSGEIVCGILRKLSESVRSAVLAELVVAVGVVVRIIMIVCGNCGVDLIFSQDGESVLVIRLDDSCYCYDIVVVLIIITIIIIIIKTLVIVGFSALSYRSMYAGVADKGVCLAAEVIEVFARLIVIII